MSGTTSKEERRNLRKEMGAVAAAAVVELQGVVRNVQLEHRVLARQMADFEVTVSTVRQGRATDQARLVNQGVRLDDLAEQIEAVSARVKSLGDSVGDSNEYIGRLLSWADAQSKLTRWQRVWSFVTGGCAVRINLVLRPANTASVTALMKDVYREAL